MKKAYQRSMSSRDKWRGNQTSLQALQPVLGCLRVYRMTASRLVSLLAMWASEKRLDQLVLSDESLVDHFFRYLEETYGCGHLAAHVAHGCIMALDEHVVSRPPAAHACCLLYLKGGSRYTCDCCKSVL